MHANRVFPPCNMRDTQIGLEQMNRAPLNQNGNFFDFSFNKNQLLVNFHRKKLPFFLLACSQSVLILLLPLLLLQLYYSKFNIPLYLIQESQKKNKIK